MKCRSTWIAAVAALGVLLFAAPDAFAGTPDVGFYDDILRRFRSAATGWQSVITNAASWLFWTLVVISMVWTFGMMALRKADIGEFFAELVRFTIFTGFFWWLLINGPNFASTIMQGLSQLGARAGGLPETPGQYGITPSGIVDVGFDIFAKIIDNMSFWPNKFHLSLMGGLMGLGILVMLCLIGINMLLLLISAWFLAYAGIFFLGFGGSRWTSDMAINYYRTVLGLAAQILAMVLLIGIGKTFLDQYYAALENDISASNLKAMAALLMACVVLFALTSRIPPLLAGIITGSAVGGGGVGNMMGFGTLAAAAGMAGAAIATGGAALAAGGAATAGGAQALMAAASKASANVAAGTDVLSGLMGGGGGSDGGGGGSDGGGGGGGGKTSTPLGQAAGIASASSAGMASASSSGSKASAGGQGGGQGGGSQSSKSGGQGGQRSAGQGGQQTASSSGKASGVMSSLGTATRIAADTGANLAKGIGDVAKAKAADIGDTAKSRIRETLGGKIATAIKASGQQGHAQEAMPEPAPTFSDNSLAAADTSNTDTDADPASEVAAFVQRGGGPDEKTA